MLASVSHAVRLLLMVIAICLLASPVFAGAVVYDYDPLGQLESVTNSTTTSHYTPDRTGNMMHVNSIQLLGDTQRIRAISGLR